MSLVLTGINRFPLKSARGEALTSATVEPWGLAGDRRWMVVDEDGCVITARETRSMLLIRPSIIHDGLRLEAAGLAPLEVAVPATSATVPVRIWESRLHVAPAAPEADAWLSTAMGRPARLVHLSDPSSRPTSADFGEPGDLVSFADGYPLLLATEESLAGLNDEIARGRLAGEGPVAMIRFRPSVVVAGGEPWEEDDWRRIRIGAAEFRVVKGCARCAIPTLDPETADHGKEPIASLARIRRWDGQTWFAVNLVPDTPGERITLGDRVEVLDRVAPGSGPIRPPARRRR